MPNSKNAPDQLTEETYAPEQAPSGDDLLSGSEPAFQDTFGETDKPGKRYTVLHGYGRCAPSAVHYIDAVKFEGGVAKHVHEDVVRGWRDAANVRIKVLRDDATEMDYAEAVGMKPMNPSKMAALLGAADLDELVKVLGQGKTQQLIAALHQRIGKKQTLSSLQ